MHLDIAIKFVIFYFVFLNTYAHAYLDPGTGSIILTAIIAFFATLSTKISYFWFKLKNIFKKKNKGNEVKENNKIEENKK